MGLDYVFVDGHAVVWAVETGDDTSFHTIGHVDVPGRVKLFGDDNRLVTLRPGFGGPIELGALAAYAKTITVPDYRRTIIRSGQMVPILVQSNNVLFPAVSVDTIEVLAASTVYVEAPAAKGRVGI